MYEENNRNFAFKDIILKILFVVLIIFIVIWLFPTKSYVNNLIDAKMGTSESQIFTTNIKLMKEAALSYYVGNRLPENTDDKVKMTLKKMLEDNLLVEFKDSNGKQCDGEKSYVEVTKNEGDYSVKVNLECTDKKTYVISYIGPYDYCTLDICEKKKLIEKKEVVEVQKTPSESTVQPSNECQYVKSTNGYWTNYGVWSEWTKNKVSSSNSRQIETKKVSEKSGTKQVISGSKTETMPPKVVTVTQNGVQKKVYVCSTYYDNPGTYATPKTCYKKINIYKTIDIYSDITYYRYRDRKYVSGNSNYKWSNCNDNSLLNVGYKKTG